MGRVIIFLSGIALGAALTFGALRYHFVRAEDGWHPITRTAPTLDDLVVDVRGFGVQEWNAHRELAYAIIQDDRADLIQRAAVDDLRRTVDGAFRSLMPSGTASQ